ncbi:MAG: hypothetical protein ACLVJ6_00190 [Merdibacter sp.]
MEDCREAVRLGMEHLGGRCARIQCRCLSAGFVLMCEKDRDHHIDVNIKGT